MSAAWIDEDGNVKQLDSKAVPPETLTASDVGDLERLARTINAVREELAEIKRRWSPRVTYFRDQAVTATTTTVIRLEHGFGGRVNWEVAHWAPSVAGTEVRLGQHAETDADTLCLASGAAGTVTVRVEEAG